MSARSAIESRRMGPFAVAVNFQGLPRLLLRQEVTNKEKSMKRSMLVALVALGAGAQIASAQIYVTPALGAYIPASNLKDLRSQAEERELERSGTLGLGLNVDAGWLRGSIAYATGATITDEGLDDNEEIGDGSVLAVAADFVMRPLPRII